jgi:hypothetical protein
VAFSADDGRGNALYDVRILEGDRELAARLTGVALEMDPGPHELVAERNGARVTQSVVITEGKKAQQVVFSFPDAAGPSEVGPPPSDRGMAGTPPPGPLEHAWARPLAGGMLAGAVVATGIGAVLAGVAIGKKNDAHCDAANFCDEGPLDSARSAASGASVAFVVGGALAVGAAVTFVAFGRTRIQGVAGLNHVQLTTTWYA